MFYLPVLDAISDIESPEEIMTAGQNYTYNAETAITENISEEITSLSNITIDREKTRNALSSYLNGMAEKEMELLQTISSDISPEIPKLNRKYNLLKTATEGNSYVNRQLEAYAESIEKNNN